MLRFAQHDSSRVVCFTYLRNAPPVHRTFLVCQDFFFSVFLVAKKRVSTTRLLATTKHVGPNGVRPRGERRSPLRDTQNLRSAQTFFLARHSSLAALLVAALGPRWAKPRACWRKGSLVPPFLGA
jgi:hypothetical protein